MEFSGWGNIKKTISKQINYEENLNWDSERRGSANIPRGAGMSYGDMATNDKFNILQLEIEKTISLDESEKILTATANCTIEDVLNFIIPKNFILPVVPGSRFITLGGAVSNDVHGKNHMQQGTFGDHVIEFEIWDGYGKPKIVKKDSPEFNFIISGLGLFGVITTIKIKLLPIAGNIMKTNFSIESNFQATLKKLENNAHYAQFNLAWIDLQSKKNFGRSIVYSSEISNQRTEFIPSTNLVKIPKVPFNLLQKPLMNTYNKIKIFKAKYSKTTYTESIWETLFPSDLFRNWSNLFGPEGLMEYQFQFSDKNLDEIENLIREISMKTNPALAAIKIFGKANLNLMSFPQQGFVFGVTFPWKEALADELPVWDSKLVKLGCKKYLAKDLFTSREVIAQMYKNIDKLAELKKKYDPENFWSSDMSRRIGIN
jgi:decaprenylphospho-beta-D-ribofuranose 2-oxidase